MSDSMMEQGPWRPRTVDCGSSKEPWRSRSATDEGMAFDRRESANPLRELFDAAAQGYTLSFTCFGCERRRIFHAAAVWRHFDHKGWSSWLRDVPARFRCRVCNRRVPRLELGHSEPSDTSLPLPDPYSWKRELSRRR
jgi:hypothetical protein